MTEDVLLVFCKAPILGECKTRLARHIGVHAALEAHVTLVHDTLARLQSLAMRKVLWSSAPSKKVQTWAQDHGFDYAVQEGTDLGARMAHALAVTLAEGARSACLVGTDCPPVTAAYVQQALAKLSQADAVLGPAEDGGYGLIAVRETVPRVFDDIHWGSEHVLAQTVSAALTQDLTFELLDTIWDVDEIEDWVRYQALIGDT